MVVQYPPLVTSVDTLLRTRVFSKISWRYEYKDTAVEVVNVANDRVGSDREEL